MPQNIFQPETFQIRIRGLRTSNNLLIFNSCVEIFYISPYSFLFLKTGINFTFTVSVTSILHQLGNEI